MTNQIIVTTKDELSELIKESISQLLSSQIMQNIAPAENTKQFLTVEETCKFLSVARQTLYAYTSNRQIPFIKKAGKNYFKYDDLADWLNSGKRKSKEEIQNEVNNGRKFK